MIRLSVMYPKGDDVTFDHDYYRDTHMPLVHEHLGVVKTEIDRAVDGPYVCVGQLYYESMESLGAAMGGEGAGAVLADVANFTNAEAVMQISEFDPA